MYVLPQLLCIVLPVEKRRPREWKYNNSPKVTRRNRTAGQSACAQLPAIPPPRITVMKPRREAKCGLLTSPFPSRHRGKQGRITTR